MKQEIETYDYGFGFGAVVLTGLISAGVAVMATLLSIAYGFVPTPGESSVIYQDLETEQVAKSKVNKDIVYLRKQDF